MTMLTLVTMTMTGKEAEAARQRSETLRNEAIRLVEDRHVRTNRSPRLRDDEEQDREDDDEDIDDDEYDNNHHGGDQAGFKKVFLGPRQTPRQD